ncbi:M17 family metallopeptidase [Clostridium algidicarnis]|uniref:Probable cytosol aminopeptidase n=1 Tax=Clostridium algidicarnis DSM 15099 TaxID=1121295 RepID=A0A2S6FX33_9CLOT|nr:leucyl aminopeptidase [Clostridium algidicarnis]PPK47974.1 leucyl aminopeptidase [Clostridium algidicarnis DSM 15099]
MIEISNSKKYSNILIFKFQNYNLDYPENIKEILSFSKNTGNYKEIECINTLGKSSYDNIYIVGLGLTEEYNNSKLFHGLGNFILNFKNKLENIDILDNFTEDVGYTLGESIALSLYKYEGIKSKSHTIKLSNINLISDFESSIIKGYEVGTSINLSRNLSNMPSNIVTPKYLVTTSQSIAKKHNLDIEIIDKFKLEQMGMGGILSVAKGSTNDPSLIVMQYLGDKDSKDIFAIVGKGVTFDAGGITLKPGKGMEKMIYDMVGGSIAIGLMDAIGKIKPKKNIMALIPVVENMPSSKAFKPGDVITTYSGKTVEIISTDAEGRMVLCDAITYAKELGANFIIDIATLTGSCANFLGDTNLGLFTNSNELAFTLTKSGREVDEYLWRFPSNEEYLDQLKTANADIKNSGTNCGAIVASKFLEYFAEDVSFAHLDIAGFMYNTKTTGAYDKGATCIPFRTLLNFLTKE